MLTLSRVTKQYGNVTVLREIDLAVPKGRVTVVIGASGCGKSTLIRLANGLILPDRGTVLFMGAQITAATALALRRNFGYLIQEGGLFPNGSGQRGSHAAAARLVLRPDRRPHSRAGGSGSPSEKNTDRYPSQLGGERQRVALMRALMLDPEILLLDEPLGALDPLIRYDLQTDLKTLFTSLRKTVLMVTHDLGEAGYFADEIVLLREGAIEQRGPMAALIETPATDYVARFVQAQRGLVDTLAEPST